MESPRVVFLHGLESGPAGRKARLLAEHFTAYTPSLDTRDFEACVTQAATELRRFEADLLVGSSFGGGVALALLQRGLWRGPTLLLAPAIAHAGLARRLPDDVPVFILHGRQDELVPIDDSRELARTGTRELVRLIEVDDDQRLSATALRGDLVARVIELAAVAPRAGFRLATYLEDPALWLVLGIVVAHLVVGLAWAIAKALHGGGPLALGALALLALLGVALVRETARPARNAAWLTALWVASAAVAFAGVRTGLL